MSEPGGPENTYRTEANKSLDAQTFASLRGAFGVNRDQAQTNKAIRVFMGQFEKNKPLHGTDLVSVPIRSEMDERSALSVLGRLGLLPSGRSTGYGQYDSGYSRLSELGTGELKYNPSRDLHDRLPVKEYLKGIGARIHFEREGSVVAKSVEFRVDQNAAARFMRGAKDAGFRPIEQRPTKKQLKQQRGEEKEALKEQKRVIKEQDKAQLEEAKRALARMNRGQY